MNNTKQAIKDYELMLLNGARYSGNSQNNKKIFSASMLGSDLLQAYYKYKYGYTEDTKFEANTFGSIYQLGVDKAIENSDMFSLQYKSALRHEVKLPNGWTISGEMDQIDTKNKVIIDNKVTTSTTIDSIRKEGKNHNYGLQLAVYKWLLYDYQKNVLNQEPDEYKTMLAIIDKKHSLFSKKIKYDMLTFVEINTYSLEEIELMLVNKTNELQQYIDLNEEPPMCENLFWYGQKGSRKPMKCLHYCDFSHHCKYYKNSEKDTLNILMDL